MDLDAGPVQYPPAEHDYFRSPDDVYATALMFLAERFQHLLAAADDLGMIVLDSRKQESDERLRRFFQSLQVEGTPYMRLSRIVECLCLLSRPGFGGDRFGWFPLFIQLGGCGSLAL